MDSSGEDRENISPGVLGKAKHGYSRPAKRRLVVTDSDLSDEESETEIDIVKPVKNARPRKRLSLKGSGADAANTSDTASTISAALSAVGPKLDVQTLTKIYSTCIEMYQTHKITIENAFELRFLDLLGDIIDMPTFDKNDMHGAGRAIEAGARIYVCRVDKTKFSVMDLASTLNNQNKMVKRAGGNDDGAFQEQSDAEADPLNDTKAKNQKAKKRKGKQKRYIATDESKITAHFVHVSKAADRRENLKDKFDEMVDDDVDFDYNPFFYDERVEHPVDPLYTPDEIEMFSEKFTIPPAIINNAEVRSLEFLPFKFVEEFDKDMLNVWGLKHDGTDKPQNADNAPVTSHYDEHQSHLDIDEAYDPLERPAEYGPDDVSRNFDVSFVQDDGHDAEGKVAEPRTLKNLDDFFSMYTNATSKFGWCGPTFVRSQFNFNIGPPKAKKPRQKKEPVVVDHKRMDWKSNSNKYDTSNPERTVFDERAVEKWGGGRNMQPYIGIEASEDDGIYERFGVLKDEVEECDNLIPQLFRYFLDPNRTILEMCDVKFMNNEDKAYMNLQREEEDHIADAGFDLDPEQIRDMDDFANDHHEDMDGDLEVKLERNGQVDASYTFPASLGGILTGEDLLSKASEGDSLKFTKAPKPIDMHILKEAIVECLNERLHLNLDGTPREEEETKLDLATMLKQVCSMVDKRMADHLSIAIIVVGLLHVVVDKKLFMITDPSDRNNARIVCKGKLFVHKDNIPMPDRFDDEM